MKNLFLFLFTFVSIFAFGQDEIIIDGQPCGMHGSSNPGTMTYDQNTLKNRYNLPTANDFDTSLTLENFVDGTATKDKFDPTTAVEVTGYIYDVKTGGKETCNCKTGNPLFKDTHIEVTLNDQDTGFDKRFIVEVTPRLRQKMAEQGVDWTTQALRDKLEGHMVRIQGWLFYDGSHATENFSDDPDNTKGRNNWRATSWEIHPVTNLEVLDDMEAMATPLASSTDEEDMTTVASSTTPDNQASSSLNTNIMEATPMDTLIIVLLGAILGMVGQGLRVVVGIKKIGDQAVAENKSQKDLIKTQQIVLSLFIAFAIGAIAGVLAAVNSTEVEFTKSTIIAFIAAGYAGTDFIEGFMRKNPNIAGK